MNSGYALNPKKRISMFSLVVYDMNEHEFWLCPEPKEEDKYV
jgi:hypothetical protein